MSRHKKSALVSLTEAVPTRHPCRRKVESQLTGGTATEGKVTVPLLDLASLDGKEPPSCKGRSNRTRPLIHAPRAPSGLHFPKICSRLIFPKLPDGHGKTGIG